MVHRREIDGEELVFGNQGALWGNAMTWWDHGTGSIWSQPIAEAILGPRKGDRLELFPSTLTRWGPWREAHPETLALDGQSLVPLLKDAEAELQERTLFVHSQRIDTPVRWRHSAVMTERWRLVNGEELYDIEADPVEPVNLIDAESAKHIVHEMLVLFDETERATRSSH